MEEPKNKYKIKVDKDVLLDFFLVDTKDISEKHLKEIYKVFNIIIAKYYSKYSYMSDELKSIAIAALLERRPRYDPMYQPYNYIFTIFRNEVGNKIIYLTKEQPVEEVITYMHNAYNNEYSAELPPEVSRYKEHLLGNKEFKMERIPKKDVIPLTIFLRMYERRRSTEIPEFVQNSKQSIQVLYKLLKDLLQ